MMFAAPGSVEPHVKGGRLRALGVASRAPSVLAQGLPTLGEAGLPGYEATAMIALLAPARTPAPIATRLNQEVVKALNLPEVRERFFVAGTENPGRGPGLISSERALRLLYAGDLPAGETADGLFQVASSSPGQLTQVMRSEMAKWEKVIRLSGIKQ